MRDMLHDGLNTLPQDEVGLELRRLRCQCRRVDNPRHPALNTVRTQIQNPNFEHEVSGVTIIRDMFWT
jgi:hypothetical protein